MQIRLASAALALLVASVTPTFAEDAKPQGLSFKGIELGQATPADVTQKFPGADVLGSIVMASPHGYDGAAGDLYRLGQTSAGTFWFYSVDGKIERVSATFTHESYPAVVAAVKVKYGEPTETKSGAVKTRRGAEFTSETLTWRREGGAIVVRERAGRVDEMQLVMETDKIRAKDAEEAKRSIQDAAKSL